MDSASTPSQKRLMQFPMLTARQAVLAVVLPAIFCGHPAQAHAILLASDPAARAQLAPGSVVFTLHYNSRIDHARSRLTLIAADHTQTRLPIDGSSAADGITTALDATAGAWTIRWQVLALDGHITRGDLPFVVAAP